MPNPISASPRLCAMLLLALPATAAEPLEWKWAEGDSSRYQVTQTMQVSLDAGPAGKIDNTMKHLTVLRWDCEGQADDGGAKILQTTERVVMKNEGMPGQGFRYDSADEDPPAGMAALMAPMFEAIVSHPFTMTMSPRGEVADVELPEDLSKAFERLPGGALSTEMVTQSTKETVLQLPEDPLAVGDKWTKSSEVNAPQLGPVVVRSTYEYLGPKDFDGKTYEAFAPSIEIEPVAQEGGPNVSVETTDTIGEILFDREAGRVFRGRAVHTMVIRMDLGGQEVESEVVQGGEFRMLGPDEGPDLEPVGGADQKTVRETEPVDSAGEE